MLRAFFQGLRPWALAGASHPCPELTKPNAMTHEPDDQPLLSESHKAELLRGLDSYGRVARENEGLAQRIYTASADHLNSSQSALPFTTRSRPVMVWSRIALAACVLLAFALMARLVLVPSTPESPRGNSAGLIAASDGNAPSELTIDLEPATDRDTVLFALLDAGASGHLEFVDDLDGSDNYGIAFAPILGTAGFELNDFAQEIQSIEGSMRR